VLDSLGVALGALDGEPVAMVREQAQEFGGAPLATLIGAGNSAPDRAPLYNGALVRYLDFNYSYLVPGEPCHPSDNLAPVLAAAEYGRADGRTLLTALAVAYQVQNRLLGGGARAGQGLPSHHPGRLRGRRRRRASARPG
jgi:2-methylcitrate dehydratase